MRNQQEIGLRDGIKPTYRLGIVLLGIFLVGFGAGRMLTGRTNYIHPWGMAFAPFSILIGILLIAASILTWARNKQLR